MKTTLSELAVLGGPPAFEDLLHVGVPNLGSRDDLLARFNDILDRKWFTNNGIYVREFEAKICELVDSEHCVATSNGTIALELAIRALGLTGEVIVPSFTFVATAHALQWQEIKPVFCDIDPHTHHIDVDKVESLITPLTTGIVGVHLWGNPCNVEALADIADRNGLRLLLDAAHAFGVSCGDHMIGNFGDAECFSFHATKFCTSFEGGAIATNNAELAEKLQLMRNFGFDGPDNVIHIGTNGKMNEMSAAMGITSIESIDEFVKVNHQRYEQYRAALATVSGVELYEHQATSRHNFQYAVALIDESTAGISRDALLRTLHAEKVLARRYFYPGCHRMEPYRSYQPHAGLLLPETESVASKVLVLPTGKGVTEEQVDTICELLRFAANNGPELSQRLAQM